MNANTCNDDTNYTCDINTEIVEEITEDVYPPLMTAPDFKLFKEAIIQRQNWAQFVNDTFPNISDKLNGILQRLQPPENNNDVIFWLGGSRAWEHNFKNTNGLDEMEKSAISAGNYDIFMLYNDWQTLVDDYDKLFDKLDNLVKTYNIQMQTNKSHGTSNDIRLKLIQMRKPTFDKNGDSKFLDMCTISHCYSFFIEVSYYQNASSSEQNDRHRKPRQKSIYVDKLLVYIEMGLNKIGSMNMNIPYFRNTYINNCVLNENGLYLMSSMLSNDRKDKGFNVDSYRTRLIQNFITNRDGTNLTNLKSELIPLINQEYIKTNFIKELFKPNNTFGEYTYFIISTLRSHIYSYIIHANKLLIHANKNSKFGTLCGPFLAGGDAILRYLPLNQIYSNYNFIKTNDIDVKLLYSNKNKLQCLKEYIMNCMIFYTKHLESTFYIDDEMYNIENDFQSDKIELKLHKLHKLHVNSTTPNNKAHNNLFRLRLIESSDEFPVDLFTIDLRLPYKVFEGTKLVHTDVHDIPVFDFVLQHQESINCTDINVNKIGGFGFPIASKDYILKDFNQTYTTLPLAQARASGEKQPKDMERYDGMRFGERTNDWIYDVEPSLYRTIVHSINQSNPNNNSPENTYDNSSIKQYRILFKYRKRTKSRCYLKHKLPYGHKKLKALYDEYANKQSKKSTCNLVADERNWNSFILDDEQNNSNTSMLDVSSTQPSRDHEDTGDNNEVEVGDWPSHVVIPPQDKRKNWNVEVRKPKERPTKIPRFEAWTGGKTRFKLTDYGKDIATYLKQRDRQFYKKYLKDPKSFKNNANELKLDIYLHDFMFLNQKN